MENKIQKIEIIHEDKKTKVFINGDSVEKIKNLEFKHNANSNECTLCLEIEVL